MAKKKKEKVTYYDDNSTISDISNVTRIGQKNPPPPREPKKQSTFKEKWRTYWTTVKMMVIPLCVALLIMGVLYLFFMFLGGGFG